MKATPRLLPSLLLVLCSPSFGIAQWVSVGNADRTTIVSQSEIRMTSGTATLTVSVLADDLARVRFLAAPTDRPDRSWAVVRTSWPAPSANTVDSPDSVTLSTAKMTVVVRKHPIRIIFRDPGGTVINEDDPGLGIAVNGKELNVAKRMPPDERYYGFGEKANQFLRGDQHMTMWNSDIPGYTMSTDPLYESIPFFYGIRNGKAYGIFLDNTWRSSFDMGKGARDRYSFGVEAGEMNYYFFAGPEPRAILARFTELVGTMPLPPLWSLGFQQSRWSYPSEKRVREIAGGFRSRSIPCDVIYLDIDYMNGYRIFTWHPERFPRPKAMIGDLTAQGFHIAVIVDPGIKTDSTYAAFRTGLAGNHFVRYPDGRLYTGKVWPGICAFPDFTSESARRWWGDQLPALTIPGVRGYWNDMNEPSVFDSPTHSIDPTVIHENDGYPTTHNESHNVYGMEMTRATYEGALRALPDERPFVLTRASYAGGWRYSAAWTGDNMANWTHLQMALTMCLALSMSGQPFCGSDIGGFVGNPSGELFARWLQLGVFTPLMRAHSVIDAADKEPWVYGDRWTAINRSTINLRYAFLPTIYTEMERASRSGIPPMRPPVFVYPGDQRFVKDDEEFLFGANLLVAPVVLENETRKLVRFPDDGSWYEFATGKPHAGGTTDSVSAPMDYLPIFARHGSVVATRTPVQYTGQAPIDPLILTVFPPDSGSTGSGDLYEDDGLSFEFRKGIFSRRSFRTSWNGGMLVLECSAAQGTYTPSARNLTVRFMALSGSPRSVTIDGKKVDNWRFDPAGRVLVLTIPDSQQARRFAVGL